MTERPTDPKPLASMIVGPHIELAGRRFWPFVFAYTGATYPEAVLEGRPFMAPDDNLEPY